MDISIWKFNRIIIDILLQATPFDEWSASRFDITTQTMPYLKEMYKDSPHSSMLGEAHTYSNNMLELGLGHDWLADYYGYEVGRSWGAANSIQNIWRRSFRPLKKLCLLTSARNEGPYILEYVAYYKVLGFDLFIYSNDNDDGSDELFEALAKRGEIYYAKNIQGNVIPQGKAFTHALSLNREILNYEWCLLGDMDEFLWINPDKFASLEEFLDYHDSLSSQSIFINWTMVGANSHLFYNSENSLQRFSHSYGQEARIGKTIFKPRYAYGAFCHFPYYVNHRAVIRTRANGSLLNMTPSTCGVPNYGQTNPVKGDSATIFHYYSKSFEEFIMKCSRNDGGKAKIDIPNFSRMTPNYFREFATYFNVHDSVIPYSSGFFARYLSKIAEYMLDVDIKNAHEQIQSKFSHKLIKYKQLFKEYMCNNKELYEEISKILNGNISGFFHH